METPKTVDAAFCDVESTGGSSALDGVSTNLKQNLGRRLWWKRMRVVWSPVK